MLLIEIQEPERIGLKMLKYALSFVLLLLVSACSGAALLSTQPPEPTNTPTPEGITFASPNFVFQGQDPSVPIVSHNPSPQIQNTYINPGAVIYYQGQFHMFFNSFTNWPGLVQIGYMTSPDGLHWEIAQDQPVFTSDQVPYGEGQADVSSAQVLDDGTWVLYFHTITDGQIGLATSDSPLGPWTVMPEPVLDAGPEGSWNDRGVYWPDVIRVDNTYYMYFAGRTAANTSIGLATSEDGRTWSAYDDPSTSEERYAHSDPVLEADADWQLFKADRPRVQHTPDGWVMIFSGSQVELRGLALSRDGLVWETYPNNPFMGPENFPISNARTWDTALVYFEQRYLYLMEIGGLGGTDLYLAVHQGSLSQ
ncbi:MAG: hypothetical protein PVF49_07305 [Anaerolineales bacterium]|jgi:predicted GH43/DUF377 family glycosyl hydrolase